eukprot:TRINITY_DN5378_c3_g1_i4.p3 TRINITY_DN5378_c3_g1~~TRINITY_DN5378_c3_g1_i4.p3  ORF type:complete len:228 (+),score=20.59 TRINITY_DN5378_c3_g1_i4:303-986(+)
MQGIEQAQSNIKYLSQELASKSDSAESRFQEVTDQVQNQLKLLQQLFAFELKFVSLNEFTMDLLTHVHIFQGSEMQSLKHQLDVKINDKMEVIDVKMQPCDVNTQLVKSCDSSIGSVVTAIQNQLYRNLYLQVINTGLDEGYRLLATDQESVFRLTLPNNVEGDIQVLYQQPQNSSKWKVLSLQSVHENVDFSDIILQLQEFTIMQQGDLGNHLRRLYQATNEIIGE